MRKTKRNKRPINMRFDPRLLDMIDVIISKVIRSRISRTAFIECAVEDYIDEKGYKLPPPSMRGMLSRERAEEKVIEREKKKCIRY